MYADRHASRVNPASLGIAVVINVAAIAAVLFAPPVITKVLKDPDLKIFTPPPDTIPDPVPPPAERSAPKPLPRQSIDTTTPLTPIPSTDFTLPDQPPMPPAPPSQLEGTGTEPGPIRATTIVDPPKPLPVLTAPSVDPRYAADLQPTYPPEERRAGRDGRVVVRVLIGVDGRVKQVEPVSATSDAFLRVTRDRALSRWRFKPATRDGIPVEAWRTMALSFVLEDE
jgi:protein TonB